MLNKCINCSKWITCNKTEINKSICENFKFQRIEIKHIKNKGGKYDK